MKVRESKFPPGRGGETLEPVLSVPRASKGPGVPDPIPVLDQRS